MSTGDPAGGSAAQPAAAQWWQACLRDGVDVPGCLDRDDLSPVRAWLAETVHRHGRAHSIDALLRRVGYPGLTAAPYRTTVVDRV